MVRTSFLRVRSTRTGRVGVGVLVGLLLVVSVATGTVAAQSAPNCSNVNYNGDGTSANPHEVSNLDQLQCIEDQGLNRNYSLVSDIDASETAFWNGGDGFEPIGESSFSGASFNGTFDGGGHEITDLTIDRQTEDEVGLFASVDTTGTVTDVSVVDADVTGSRFVGGLAGINEGTVNGASASGNVTGDDDDVGGLIGENDGQGGRGTVTDSSASGNVTGDSDVGGLVGSSDEGTVSNSSASGNVTGDGLGIVGGLVGFNDDSTVSNSSASGNVTGDLSVGGLVGSNEGTVEMSSASGDVEGNESVGGLVGDNDESTVSNSSASGDVTGDNDDVGGLVGDNTGTVTESSASGDVEGDERVGGLVGFNTETVEKSYARGNATGNGSVGGLVGKNVGFFSAGTVNQSYATGNVTGLILIPDPLPDPFPDPLPDPTLTQDSSLSTGGLVGNNSAGTVTDSYWDVDTTGQLSSDGGTGLNTSDMIGSAAADNMTGFNFTSTWETVPGDYPILAWQDAADSGNCPFDPVVCTYDPNGDVGTGDLQAAINDFIQGDIGTGDLQAVINAFIAS